MVKKPPFPRIIDTAAEETDQELNSISDELNNLTKKAEQLGVFQNRPGMTSFLFFNLSFHFLINNSSRTRTW